MIMKRVAACAAAAGFALSATAASAQKATSVPVGGGTQATPQPFTGGGLGRVNIQVFSSEISGRKR